MTSEERNQLKTLLTSCMHTYLNEFISRMKQMALSTKAAIDGLGKIMIESIQIEDARHDEFRSFQREQERIAADFAVRLKSLEERCSIPARVKEEEPAIERIGREAVEQISRQHTES